MKNEWLECMLLTVIISGPVSVESNPPRFTHAGSTLVN